jgi:hypothetical protein
MYTAMQEKYQEVVQVVKGKYAQGPDWATFFRETLGVNGLVRRTFADPAELSAFEQSAEYEEIQLLVAKLREQNGAVPLETEPTRVITVRLPLCMHDALRNEAHEKHTSINKLCISKLLQMFDSSLVPSENGNSKEKVRHEQLQG